MSTVQNAAVSTGIGWVIDNVLGTKPLGTLFGLAHGLFRANPADLNAAYTRFKTSDLGKRVQDFGGFKMPDTLFQERPGDVAKESMQPNRASAEQTAADLEQKTGFPWGKTLLVGGAAVLGINMLTRAMFGPFGVPWYAPMMRMGPMGPMAAAGIAGGGGGGILPLALMAFLGYKAVKAMC